MISKRGHRMLFSGVIGFIVILLMLSLAILGGSSASTASLAAEQSELPPDQRKPIAPTRDNMTVMTGQGFGNQSGESLIALAPDGRLYYYENRHASYEDVDPLRGKDRTVLLSVADYPTPEECNASTACVRNTVLKINLTTGARHPLYNFTSPRSPGNIHDVEMIDEHRILVADIGYDRIFVVNITADVIEWQWEAQQDFPIRGGGEYPDDWTHVNDVEVLPDGRYMVSLRNQDQVVFIDPEEGLDANWTLGEEDAYSILYEQHNPDYIPAKNGGPAVLVADSQNNRIVEYQRKNSTWTRTWVWKDQKMNWPRDADRLPNGHTLVVDSNGGRLLEIDREGNIVWQIRVNSLYDAERLGTGDESTGGPSAQKAGLESRSTELSPRESPGDGSDRFDLLRLAVAPYFLLKSMIPEKLLNALLFVTPPGIKLPEILLLVALLITSLCWGVTEILRSDVVHVRSPVTIERKDQSKDRSEGLD